MQDRASTLQQLREAIAPAPFRFAALFGSYAKGRPRADSDIDVGFVANDPNLTLGNELEWASKISAALGKEIDLVRLDGNDLLLEAEVARTGVCVLESAPGVFASYRATALARWIEWNEMTAPHRELFLLRLASSRT